MFFPVGLSDEDKERIDRDSELKESWEQEVNDFASVTDHGLVVDPHGNILFNVPKKAVTETWTAKKVNEWVKTQLLNFENEE